MATSNNPGFTLLADGSCDVHKLHGKTVRYKKYQYTPLTQKRSIRLIKPNFHLKKPVHETEGHYRHFLIEERSLDDATLKYVPISYAWGDATDLVPLMLGSEIGGSALMITRNAWQAIHKMCGPIHEEFGPLPLWIDQICIKQDNEVEKVAQIALMAEIFSSPQRFVTVVWLGVPDDETETAFNFVKTLVKAMPFDKEFSLNPSEVFNQPHDLISKAICTRYPDRGLPLDNHPGWTSLRKIFNRAWFTRMWTFQEVVVSDPGSVLLVSASETKMCAAGMGEVTRASVLLGALEVPEYNDAVLAGRSALRAATIVQIERQNNTLNPIHYLLEVTADRDCEKPKDKVYALLNICSKNPVMDTLKIDYQKPDSTVYIDVTRKIIDSESSLLISLSASGRVGGRVNQLPSWVPDYTGKLLARNFETLNPKQVMFSAHNGYILKQTHTSTIASQDQLPVQGGIVDLVTEVIDSRLDDKAGADRIEAYLKHMVPIILAKMSPKSDEDNVDSMLLRTARTLTFGGRDTYILGYRRFSFISKAVAEKANEVGSTEGTREEDDITMLRSYIADMFSMKSPLSNEYQRQWKVDFTKQVVHCKGRKFAFLKKYGFCVVPRQTTNQDVVAVLHGSTVPVVLRYKQGNRYELVGPCYVDPIMQGEAVTWEEDEAKSFILV